MRNLSLLRKAALALPAVLFAALFSTQAVLHADSPAPPPAAPGPVPVSTAPNALVWNTLSQETTNTSSERYVKFVFCFTNVSSSDVLIHSANGSCFCTTAKLPMQPWPIPSGSNGPIEVTMDLAGKMGRVQKGVSVDTSSGRYNLTVACAITPPNPNTIGQTPTMNDSDRLKNMQAALADRQSLFKRNECASCHAEPARGKSDGALLYAGVCANCHDSPHRAAIVPDLHALHHPTDLEHWTRWIRYGRPGSMMPAFHQTEGGPLSDAQITALAQYLTRTIPSRPGPVGSSQSSVDSRQ